jgi:hypothetical protein
MTAPIASGWSGCWMGFAAVRLLHPMACPSTNSEVQDLFAKLLEKRFDRQPCCAGILYECMRFLTGHYKVNAAEEFLSFGCFRTEHRLVSAYINRIINVAWCFGHGILLDPEAGILCPFQPVLQGGNCTKPAGSRPAGFCFGLLLFSTMGVHPSYRKGQPIRD